MKKLAHHKKKEGQKRGKKEVLIGTLLPLLLRMIHFLLKNHAELRVRIYYKHSQEQLVRVKTVANRNAEPKNSAIAIAIAIERGDTRGGAAAVRSKTTTFFL